MLLFRMEELLLNEFLCHLLKPFLVCFYFTVLNFFSLKNSISYFICVKVGIVPLRIPFLSCDLILNIRSDSYAYTPVS